MAKKTFPFDTQQEGKPRKLKGHAYRDPKDQPQPLKGSSYRDPANSSQGTGEIQPPPSGNVRPPGSFYRTLQEGQPREGHFYRDLGAGDGSHLEQEQPKSTAGVHAPGNDTDPTESHMRPPAAGTLTSHGQIKKTSTVQSEESMGDLLRMPNRGVERASQIEQDALRSALAKRSSKVHRNRGRL